MILTNEQYTFLKMVSDSKSKGLTIESNNSRYFNMAAYFNNCGYISFTSRGLNNYTILPAGEIAIETYEDDQRKDKSAKMNLIVSVCAAIFAGLSLVVTIVFGVIGIILK